MLNRLERECIDDGFAEQTVNSWFFREIDSEFAKSKVNAKSISDIGSELIIIARAR